MRNLFGNLKRKLNSDRTWGKSALSLFLAALMLFSTLSSVVFAESNRTETVKEAETWFDTSAVTEALLGEPTAADAIATDAIATDATDATGTEAPETDAPAVEPTQVEWTVDIDGSEYAVISGVLPEDGSATVEPAAIPRGSETTFSAYDLTVYDGEGEVYAPEDSLAVELHSEKIAETLAEGNSVGVLEKNRYGYFTTAETVSVGGDSVKFMADENSTYYLFANQLVKTLVASDGNTYRITVLYDNDSGFPEDAEIRAEEVSLDSEDYVTYLENAAATLGVELSALTYNRLFDIAIVDDAGTEYQPNDSVRVTVELMESEAESVEDLRVVHFDDENVPTELDASTSRGAVTFETDGFSIFSFNDTSLASRVINAIFGDSKLYENDDIILTGRMPLLGTVEATPVNVQVDGRDALIAYDIKIYANSIMKLLGIPWQPSEGAVQVTVKSDVFADADGVLSVYHMQDEQSEPEFVASVDAVDSAVTFDAESFSIYAVGSVIEKTIVAEDGYTYKITVIYDESAGIPDDAELNVSEISSADMLRTAAETVGSGVESISYAKMFDISIVKDGVEYQPNENVKVSVELLDAGEVSDVQVVHFDSETEAAPLAAETDGNTVTFETEGFSVFSFLDFSVFDKVISAVLGETEGVLYENDDIILTGKMPATAVVEANRVDVDIKGKPALIAYDIKIYAHPVMKLLGINWQPTDGAIKVTYKSDALAGHENV
ncbi:MAG: hypothetical protein IKI91_03160, partial [Clostridia bacterium]|nr:hypothetical protein [Clostridia bacterium]